MDSISGQQAAQVRPILHNLHAEYKEQFDQLESYFITTGLKDGKITLFVGADSSSKLEPILPKEYQGFPLFLSENIVTMAKRMYSLEDIYAEKLQVGCNIGAKRENSRRPTLGSLGGYVRVGDDVMGMTSHHVVPNNTEFSQPSDVYVACTRHLGVIKRPEVLDQDFSAGVSTEYGVDEIVDGCRYDYQLLKIIPSRMPDQPFNKLVQEALTIKPPVYDLNDLETSTRLAEQRFEFGKIGAYTDFSRATLFNSSRSDCIVKLQEKTTHSFEFAFKPYDEMEFALKGDSGAWVFVIEKDKEPTLIGMITAVSFLSPKLVFVTPISSIQKHFQARTGLEMAFLE